MNDWAATILDEIALEGLDGISLQALWLRLENCKSSFFSQPLDKCIKNFVWNTTIKLKQVQFFLLPEPRPPLALLNWFAENDNEQKIEPPVVIYKHHAIDDPVNNIMGSCPTYNTRSDVSELARKMTLAEVYEKWDQKLVIVASQKVRFQALVGPSADPFMELFCLPFCMLERIGRSRYLGEITNSKWSLQAMGLDPKNIFYHRKYLSKRKLICKQFFYVKSGSMLVNGNGNLLHIPRFYVEYESRLLFYLNLIVDHLKNSPNFTATSDSILKIIGSNRYRKRLYKSPEFSQLIAIEAIPYKQFFPNASKKECVTSKGNEKEIKLMRLRFPDINVRSFFNQLHDDDEDEDDEEGDSIFLDEGSRLIDRSVFMQSYQIIEDAGPSGITRVELGLRLGLNRVMSRITMKMLQDQGYIDSFVVDRGKIRISQYFSMKFSKNVHEHKKIIQEKAKMIKLLGTSDKNKRKKLPFDKDENPAVKVAKLSEEEQEADLISKESIIIDWKMDQSSDNRANDEVKASEEMSTLSPKKDENTVEKISLVNFSESKNNIKVKAEQIVDVSITPTSTYLNWDTNRVLKKKPQSLRILKRKNLIMEAIQKEEIITSIHHLKKIIMKAEESDEDNVQIDKKTLLKLLLRLEAEGHIKTYSFIMEAKTRLEKLTLICLPHITTDHHFIKNAIDHAKLRMSTISKEKVKAASKSSSDRSVAIPPPTFSVSSKLDSKDQAQDVSALSGVFLQNFRNVPKFVKIQLIHQLLYYQVHFYEGDENLDQEEVRKEISTVTDLNTIKDVELPKVYYFSKDLNWKLFIPPSSKSSEVEKGWITIGEMVLRMPLSMLIQICSLNYLIPEIYDYLSHPVYKHILLKDLPISIRSALTYGRMYVLAIHRVLTLASYLGLVQFGPHRHKDKDLILVYLNRKASLYNTVSSRRGYIYTSSDIEYPKITYYFRSMDDVNQFWIDAWMFCTNTQLGSRGEMSGKSVVIESLDAKPAMIEAVSERSFSEVEQFDNGEIPGDHRGAAGFDSAFYSHLKRNWHWSNSAQRKPIKLHPCLQTVKVTGGATKGTTEIPPLGTVQKLEASCGTIVVKKIKTKPPLASCVPKQFIKKSLPRVKKFKEKAVRARKPHYDQIDKDALANLKSERATWSQEEDNILLLFKVAALFFNQKNQRCISYYRTARDFLHQKTTHSRNKTSKAVQRRLLHLSRRPQIKHCISVCKAETQADKSLVNQFSEAIEQSVGDCSERDVKHRNKIVLKAIVELTEILMKRYPRIYISCFNNEVNKPGFIPNSLSELRSMYQFSHPNLEINKPKPLTSVDIFISVITTLVYSSICSQSCKTSYSLQLFYAFKHYPEKYLRQALSKLQSEQMISRRKSAARYSKMKVSSFLPISSSCYQLSHMYSIKLMSKYQHIIFKETYLTNLELINANDMSIDSYNGGKAAVLSSYLFSNKVSFNISIPDQLIALNPGINDDRLCNVRILTRVKNYFAGSSNFYSSKEKDESKSLSDSDNSDSDFEMNILGNFAKTAKISSLKPKKSDDLTGKIAQNFKSEDLFFVKGCQFGIEFKQPNELFIPLLQSDGTYILKTFSQFQSLANSILNEFKSTFIYFIPDFEAIKRILTNLNDGAKNAERILNFIEQKKELGAISEEIGENFGFTSHIYSILRGLIKHKVVLRTGTIKRRYIHHKYSRSWLVHSFQLVRLDRESLDVDAVSNVVLQKEGSKIINISEIDGEIDSMKSTISASAATKDPTNEQDEKSIKNCETESGKSESRVSSEHNSVSIKPNNKDGVINTNLAKFSGRKRKKIVTDSNDSSKDKQAYSYNIKSKKKKIDTAEEVFKGSDLIKKCSSDAGKKDKDQKDVSKIKSISENVKKQLTILVRPWVKPDGCLNRRVLDRFLGIVLSRIMEKPFCSVRTVQETFVPLLEPMHTYELVEILEKLGCIALKAKIITGKVSLFSSGTTSIKLVPAVGLESEENILIHVGCDAIVNLGHFIGKPAYASDFMV